jgi:hypothetical protein
MTTPDGSAYPKLVAGQRTLDALLIIAFNAGWAAMENRVINGLSLEAARSEVVGKLLEMVEGVDPGDLAAPVATMFGQRDAEFLQEHWRLGSKKR